MKITEKQMQSRKTVNRLVSDFLDVLGQDIENLPTYEESFFALSLVLQRLAGELMKDQNQEETP